MTTQQRRGAYSVPAAVTSWHTPDVGLLDIMKAPIIYFCFFVLVSPITINASAVETVTNRVQELKSKAELLLAKVKAMNRFPSVAAFIRDTITELDQLPVGEEPIVADANHIGKLDEIENRLNRIESALRPRPPPWQRPPPLPHPWTRLYFIGGCFLLLLMWVVFRIAGHLGARQQNG